MKVFKEEQRFTQMWLLVVLIITFAVVLISVFLTYTEANKLSELFVVFLVMLLVFGLIFSLKLVTRIDEKGVYYRFKPFHFKTKFVSWNLIKKAYVRKYSPISEYGGWGIKGGKLWNKSKGIAYNVSGDIGLQLELKNGKKILLGTKKQEEIKRVLEVYKKKFLSDEIYR